MCSQQPSICIRVCIFYSVLFMVNFTWVCSNSNNSECLLNVNKVLSTWSSIACVDIYGVINFLGRRISLCFRKINIFCLSSWILSVLEVMQILECAKLEYLPHNEPHLPSVLTSSIEPPPPHHTFLCLLTEVGKQCVAVLLPPGSCLFCTLPAMLMCQLGDAIIPRTWVNMILDVSVDISS